MDLDSAIDVARSHLSTLRSEQVIPGVVWALLRDGEVLHVEGVGEAVVDSGRAPDSHTVFRIASMTKSFTAAAVLLLRDRGLLRLDDPLVLHCPWAAGIGAPTDSAPITIRDLLTMQAGLPTDDPWGDRQENLPIEDFDRLVAGGLSFSRRPRTSFEYSNLGYALLGRVISEVSGADYRDFVRDELLLPLGMNSTGFESAAVEAHRLAQGYSPVTGGMVAEPFSSPGAFSAMGGLLSNVHDVAVWVAGFQNALADRPAAHPLSATSLREMQQPHRLVDTTITRAPSGDPDAAPSIVTTSYCFGLVTDDNHALGRFVSHSGGYPGFGSHMRWHQGTGWAIVGLGNRSYAHMRRVCGAILGEIVAGTPVVPVATLWVETEVAMAVAESLVNSWDDTLADAHLAMNVDLDFPRAERRAEWQRAAAELGPLRRANSPVESDSPAHVRWWVEGEGGRAQLEVLLTPEREPRIQALMVKPEVSLDS